MPNSHPFRFRFLLRCTAISCFAALCFFVFASRETIRGQEQPKPLDPKAWGSNHINQEVPEFVNGEQCLFCHRMSIGANWLKNIHAISLRQIEGADELKPLLKQPELASITKEIEYVLGAKHNVRFLKKDGYGKFAMLPIQAEIDSNGKIVKWIDKDKLTWEKEKFANQCVGCHASGVDPKTKAFSTFGHDCYVCHGNVNLDHPNDTSLVLLSKQRRKDAQVVNALCAQCHLRGGKAKSTGLPYANNFIAGDNLWQDYEVDWVKADDEKLNPMDRHIYFNARDVALYGKTTTNCINCHQTHNINKAEATVKHKTQPQSPLCFTCHTNDSPLKAVKPYQVKSSLCEY